VQVILTSRKIKGGEKMDAIITAGGRLKPGDPLLELTHIEKKALIPLAGRPMVGWVVEAVRGSGIVGNIALVGLTPEEFPVDDSQLYYIEPADSLIDNIFAGLDKLRGLTPDLKKFLLFSSDIPLITPEIVRGFVAECGDQSGEMYYAGIEERTMEARFPGSKRSYVPFKGGRYCGGDAFLVDVAASYGNIDLARKLTGSRKNYLAQLMLTNIGFIIRFLLRRMTIHDMAEEVVDLVGFRPKAVDTKFAELGMDLDKLHQYEIIKAELEQRVGSQA
jgi:GTP:adenosylcobinamide-phosphate guanylyltransferase